ESLKEYLIASDELNIANNQTGKETINKIIQQQELSKEEIAFAEKNAFKIIDALEQVKICDPAIGSGAFPMGLLQEIFNAQIYLQELKGFKKGTTDAQIKKHIIEESIYGVDIDAGAVDIARLRFWLSLVVDETEPQPLPNLSFKIVCANTLIPLGKIKNLDMGGTKEIADGLAQVRHDYFNASMEEKTALETKFTSLQKKLLTTAKEWVSKEDADVYQRLLEFSPFEDTSCTWFDAWWMFGVKDGFDIVIGNPPYVNVENLESTTKKHLFDNYETCKGRTDLYVAFIEKSMSLLNENGGFVFIIPYPYTNQNYGSLSRKMLIDKYWVTEILDTSEYYVFDTAVVKTIILSVSKTANKGNTKIKIAKSKDDFNDKSFTEYNVNQTSFLELKDFRFETKDITEALTLKKQVWNNSIRLYEICLIAYGARLNHKTKDIGKDYFIHNDYTDGYKPFTEGKNIERYYFKQYGWLNYQPTEHYNSMFTELFENDKIFFINVVKDKLRFAFDNKHYYNSHTVINCVKWNLLQNASHSTVKRNITNKKILVAENFDYKYLLAILNSNVINWYFINFLSESLHFYPDDAKELPIKNVNPSQQFVFINLVDYLLYLYDNKQSEQLFPHTSNERIAAHIEDVLNMMVYELYFENHMKDVNINVLKFVNEELLKMQNDKMLINNLPLTIKHFYLWLQTPDNPVRQRINIVDIKSPNIISKINLATQ
ncbi:MAG: Eco57I restriction-modification methylase domain-containing protein, partial [Bacteroidetes bacterium]|nr:Eco57I restriction-modification methylase domain-containing protein [Bacteroidota bacterium]